jgi:hypothetical protein
MSAECPCGRARAGCTYHDPALQPPPGPTYSVDDVQVSVGGVVLGNPAPASFSTKHGGQVYGVTRIPGTNVPGIDIEVGGLLLRDCDYELVLFPSPGASAAKMYNLMINVAAPTDTELKLHAMFAAMTPPVVRNRINIAVRIDRMLDSVQTWWVDRHVKHSAKVTYKLRGVW